MNTIHYFAERRTTFFRDKITPIVRRDHERPALMKLISAVPVYDPHRSGEKALGHSPELMFLHNAGQLVMVVESKAILQRVDPRS